MIRAIIFDFNGVLDEIDEERLNSLAEALRAKHIDEKDIEPYAKEILVSIERIDTYNPSLSMRAIVKQAFEEFLNNETLNCENVDVLVDIYFNEREKFKKITPDFINLIKNLTKNYTLFILSHSPIDSILKALKNSKISPDIFAEIYSTAGSNIKKPCTQIYKALLKKHNLKPEECIMVGDNVISDLMPAKVLGIKTVICSRWVDAYLENISQLPSVI